MTKRGLRCGHDCISCSYRWDRGDHSLGTPAQDRHVPHGRKTSGLVTLLVVADCRVVVSVAAAAATTAWHRTGISAGRRLLLKYEVHGVNVSARERTPLQRC